MPAERTPARRGAGRAIIAALLWLIPAAGVAADRDASPGQLVGAAALRPFFAALAGLERHHSRGPVRIIQIGDSHTANDAFSGRLRERLQARFGDAGRGWLPAGIPYKYYRPAFVSVAETGWRHVRPVDGGRAAGLDGVVAEAAEPGARMRLTGAPEHGFDRVAIEFIGRPHGVPLTLRIDNGRAQPIPTASRRTAPRRFEKSLAGDAHAIELAAAMSGEQVLAWSVERRRPGIIYENHGAIGATVALLADLAPGVVAFELTDRRPALLVIAYGTNEGFEDALDLRAYADAFRAAVVGLQRRAHGAPVLVVGPPDGNRLRPGCPAEAVSACGGHAACSWSEPRNLAAVRGIQRRIARGAGWAFWDWSAAMGGRCSIARWLGRDPALAMPDHVHLSKIGYAAAADALFADLMAAYDARMRDHAVRR